MTGKWELGIMLLVKKIGRPFHLKANGRHQYAMTY